MKVQYLGSVKIQCNLVSKTLLNEMNNINSIEKKYNSDNYRFELNTQNIFRENISDFDMSDSHLRKKIVLFASMKVL